MSTSRRQLLHAGVSLLPAAALARLPSTRPTAAASGPAPLFRISLAQWSLHRTLRGGQLDPLDFPAFAREEFGLDAVEYVNGFFPDKATDFDYLGQLKQRAAEAGVQGLLVMIDGEGHLAGRDEEERRRTVESHFKWIAAAAFLGCHSIRVNASGSGSREEMHAAAVDSLRRLGDYGAQYGVDVIVENHGGLSSDGSWMAGVMKAADHPRVGTLPDFGNFHMGDGKWYDRYKGVREMMPWARAVSAKSYGFDADGNEIKTDFARMLEIVVVAGYRGHVGIEWEGKEPSEVEGIRLTQGLLERVREDLAARGH